MVTTRRPANLSPVRWGSDMVALFRVRVISGSSFTLHILFQFDWYILLLWVCFAFTSLSLEIVLCK